jgi:glycosyltransferase involved in cell wall biosynthesis
VLRILFAHNSYQMPGGEDSVVTAEIALLRSRGHEVEALLRHNDELAMRGMADRARAARDCVWSASSAEAIRAAIQRFRPDVLHVHNTFAVLSPSIYWAASACGVPVVQTLHNYRLACPQNYFLREGRICQDCLGRVPLPGVVHSCYHNSRAQTLAIAVMLTTHRALGTWSSKVSRYIALSVFCREKFIAAGLPAEKICIKPNFAASPTPPKAVAGDYERNTAAKFLFVGRMSPEKGLSVLAQALQSDDTLSCIAIGDGPAKAELASVGGIRTTGWLESPAVSERMYQALALVVPSVWFEPFALVTIEAFAHGLPVIASRIGSLPEIITDGQTGLLFEPGNARDLVRKMRWAREHPTQMQRMGDAARAVHEKRFSASENYRQLIGVYQDAIAAAPH